MANGTWAAGRAIPPHGSDWRQFFRLGVVHFMLYPQTATGEGPILESLTELARDPDLEVVEITHIASPQVRQQVRRLLEGANLTAAFGAQPVFLREHLDLEAGEASARMQALQRAKACIDEAAELGAVAVAFLSGQDPADPAQRAAARARLAESLVELSAYGARCGLRVVLETFDRDVDKHCLIGPTVEAVEVAQAVSRVQANFGLMLDLSHLPLLRESPEEALRTVGRYLVHAHVGNAVTDPSSPLYGDAHPGFGEPGGVNTPHELARFLRELFRIGYLNGQGLPSRPIVSFEVKPQADEESQVIWAGAKRVLTAAWAELSL